MPANILTTPNKNNEEGSHNSNILKV